MIMAWHSTRSVPLIPWKVQRHNGKLEIFRRIFEECHLDAIAERVLHTAPKSNSFYWISVINQAFSVDWGESRISSTWQKSLIYSSSWLSPRKSFVKGKRFVQVWRKPRAGKSTITQRECFKVTRHLIVAKITKLHITHCIKSHPYPQ